MAIRTYYRVWWALGGYKHYDTEDEARNAKHPNPERDFDKPVRIDKIEILFSDVKIENEVEAERHRRIMNKNVE